MNRHFAIAISIAAFVSLSGAGPSRCARAGDVPLDAPAFDQLVADVGPYMDRRDPLSLDLKVDAVSTSEYQFWRGTKGLFFRWAKANCADWLADRGSYVVSHGDLHFGNIGTYATAGGWGKMALGMVDFDESARLPFQLELLQGLVTINLLAGDNDIDLTADQQQQISDALFDAYVAALKSGKTATQLLAGDTSVSAMLDATNTQGDDYADEIKRYAKKGHFKPAKRDSGNVLTPVDASRWPGFAAAIAEAAANDPRLASMLKVHDAAAVRPLIKDVAKRVRTGSSGSQGLEKYFVLLDHPLTNYDGDVILYLKREIPTAAERAGAIPPDPRPQGQRYAQDMAVLTNPPPMLSSWAALEGGSYWVTFKEPWSAEYSYQTIHTFNALKQAAVVWGDVAGAAHARNGDGKALADLVGASLRRSLSQRSELLTQHVGHLFKSMLNDPRTQRCEAAVAAVQK